MTFDLEANSFSFYDREWFDIVLFIWFLEPFMKCLDMLQPLLYLTFFNELLFRDFKISENTEKYFIYIHLLILYMGFLILPYVL